MTNFYDDKFEVCDEKFETARNALKPCVSAHLMKAEKFESCDEKLKDEKSCDEEL